MQEYICIMYQSDATYSAYHPFPSTFPCSFSLILPPAVSLELFTLHAALRARESIWWMYQLCTPGISPWIYEDSPEKILSSNNGVSASCFVRLPVLDRFCISLYVSRFFSFSLFVLSSLGSATSDSYEIQALYDFPLTVTVFKIYYILITVLWRFD